MEFKIYFAFQLLLKILRILDASEVEFDADPDIHWENFKKTYQKVYDGEEDIVRRRNFENNFKKITEHNQRFSMGMYSYRLGFNEFADMVLSDFLKIVNGLIKGETAAPIPFVVPKDADIPDSVDWREEGAVSPVKNQGLCGSCYSFSATGALEGQNKLRRGQLVSLSEQNIIDCSQRDGNSGCEGGVMDYAFQYVMMNHGIDSAESYPYEGKVGRCSYSRQDSATDCSGYSDVTPRDETTLQVAVALVGPISVGIDASHESFTLYKEGIYDEPLCSSTDLDHAVLLVGYGSENGTDYWIVKNSWGTSWGEDGYIRMSRNKNNQCGIASQASFPVV